MPVSYTGWRGSGGGGGQSGVTGFSSFFRSLGAKVLLMVSLGFLEQKLEE